MGSELTPQPCGYRASRGPGQVAGASICALCALCDVCALCALCERYFPKTEASISSATGVWALVIAWSP
jgi:hypothetical protein